MSADSLVSNPMNGQSYNRYSYVENANKTAIAYTYCTGLPTGESCPANAQFEVVATPETSSGAQNGPITVTYYDGLSRVLAGDVEGFDGAGTGCSASAPCWIRTATQHLRRARAQDRVERSGHGRLVLRL